MTSDIRRGKAALIALIAVQGVCAIFYLFDVAIDFGEPGADAHTVLELIVTGALLSGVLGMSWQLRALLRRQRRIEGEIRAASGALYEVLQEYFAEWRLTPAERDVALFSFKGLSIAEIAAARETAEGTVKAQLNAIYRKAGVSGRPQLLSLCIETLLGEGLGPETRPEGAGVQG